jgi:uncharacterized protein YjgD (DUF1641 family)
MAKAITQFNKKVPDPVEEQRQAIEQLIEMTADSRNALMETLEIMQRLQEYGVLEAVKALLNKGPQVSALAIQQMNQPGTYHMIKNIIYMVELISSIDPEKTGAMTSGLTYGMDRASDALRAKEQTSVWGLMKIMKDPDVNTAMTAGISFLKGMGEQLRSSANPETK